MSDVTTVMDRGVAVDFSDPTIYHDRVFIVGGERFYVFSGMLTFWSEHFRAMFTGNFIEANNKEIELKEVDADIFKKYLQILYKNHCELEATDIVPLLHISYRFLTPVVLEFCKKYIDKNFSSLDFVRIDLLRTVCLYDNKPLMTKIIDSFKNYDKTRKLEFGDLFDVVIEFNLVDLKAWLAKYISIHVHFDTIVEMVGCAKKLKIPNTRESINREIGKLGYYQIPVNRVIEMMMWAFENKLPNLKKKIAATFKKEKMISEFKVGNILDFVIKYNSEDIKDWLDYISKNVTADNCVEMLAASESFKIPVLKEGINHRIENWSLSSIKMEQIIEMTKLAYHYDLQNLKTHVRKQIAQLCRNGVPFAEKFLVKYYDQINAQPKHINDFIILSAAY